MSCFLRNRFFHLLMLFVVGFLSFVPNVMAKDQLHSKEDIQKMYMEYLNQEGYSPKVDEDGDVQFKSEGKVFFIAVDEDDPEYLRIVLPNIWSLDNNQERGRALIASDEANRTVKVMKIFTANNNVWASIESFVAEPQHFSGIFRRSLSALQAGAMYFASKMSSLKNELQNSGAAMPDKFPTRDIKMGVI